MTTARYVRNRAIGGEGNPWAGRHWLGPTGRGGGAGAWLTYTCVCILMAGCLGINSSPDASTTGPTANAAPDYVAKAGPDPGRIVLLANMRPYGDDAAVVVMGNDVAAETIRISLQNLRDNTSVTTPDAARPGHPISGFASASGQTVYAVANVLPPGTGINAVSSWIDFAVLEGEQWRLEEAPARWAFTSAYGIAATATGVKVLVGGVHALQLWTLQGETWSSITIPDANTRTLTRFALATANGTAHIMGLDTLGRVATWKISESGTIEGPTVRDDATNVDSFVAFDVSAHSDSVAFAWTYSGSPLGNRAQETRMTRVAFLEQGAWISADLPGSDRLLQAIVKTESGAFVMEHPYSGGGHNHLWNWNGTAWLECTPSWDLARADPVALSAANGVARLDGLSLLDTALVLRATPESAITCEG